jgi:manganese/zinc-transporting P-type ATPase C
MAVINIQIKVQHAVNGRIRFKIPAIRFNRAACRQYEALFRDMNGIRGVAANPKSASLVVRYDPRTLSRSEVVQKIGGRAMAGRKTLAGKRITCSRPANAARKDSLQPALWRFIGLTLLVGVVFVREVLLKRPLAQSLFSPLGLITSAAALPLVKRSLVKLKEGRMTLESFLGGSIIAAVAAGQATAALEILWITSGGELLQGWITERSRRAIRDILKVTEKEAYVLTGGVEVSIPVDQVQPGDTVVLHTGEKIAVDGEIIKGEALIDESPITGRSEPATRTRGAKVCAGTFVRQGVIFVKAEQVGDRTYLARILRMVEDSLENKAPIEGVADRLAQNLIQTGFAVTAATLMLTGSPWRAFTVMLVMACPCATILAASTAISAAISAAARRHILIKGGRYLEEVGRANVICFDKTGTLTTNEPEIRQLINFNGLPEDALLQLAYATETHNSHPVALAIKREAKKRGIPPISHEVCEYFLGKGVRSEIHGDEILVGSHKLMAQFAVDPERVKAHLEKVKLQGLTLVFIAKNRALLGVVGFANQDRRDVADVIRHLQGDGFKKTAMITGDSKYSALEMAQRLNFDECRYSVLPEEKADIVAGLRNNGDKVLMVGDGINDALALAEADVGVAMGAGGSEVAIEAADIALVKDELSGVVYVRALSRKTLAVVHQNFWIATGSNIAGVTLGAFGLLSPVMAGLVHIGHTLGILANSSRLLFFEQPPIPAGPPPPSRSTIEGLDGPAAQSGRPPKKPDTTTKGEFNDAGHFDGSGKKAGRTAGVSRKPRP